MIWVKSRRRLRERVNEPATGGTVWGTSARWLGSGADGACLSHGTTLIDAVPLFPGGGNGGCPWGLFDTSIAAFTSFIDREGLETGLSHSK